MEPQPANSIHQLIQRIQEVPLARRDWPPERDLQFTLPDLLAIHAGQVSDRLNQTISLVDALLQVPIIAVAGLNDQGKSSLVASFLSHSGAARALRGTKGKQGTFRFILWLPAKWGADCGLRASLDKALSAIFGCAPELLPEDIPSAHVAQNNHNALDIPLIAWDEKLDKLGIALLDCPDVQKQPKVEIQNSAKLRLRMLRRASKICAGIILVARHENLTTKSFGEVAKSFPGCLRIYALNMARDSSPDEILMEARDALLLRDNALCYAAYDFGLIYFTKHTPPWDPNLQVDVGKREHPCFFRLAASSDPNSRDNIEPDRSLLCLAQQIDKEALVRDFQRETLIRLKDEAMQGIDMINAELNGQSKRIAQECSHVWKACNAALRGEDGERLILSAEMTNSLSESIIDCAPVYLILLS